MSVAARSVGRLLACASAAVVASVTASAGAQMRGRAPRPAAPPRSEPNPSAGDDRGDETPTAHTEPDIAPPADPLLISPEARARIGSDWDRGPPAPVGPLVHRNWLPYEERQGDLRLRLLPPLWMEQTRGLRDPSQGRYGVPDAVDTEGLYGLLYYRRRSPRLDMDVVFPAFWRVRSGTSHTVVVGPFVHREAEGEHDNWLAPLYFEGKREGGGYFHSPALLTTSHWNTEGAFTLAGPYFRSRTGANVDLGVAPFFFHGDTGSLDGNRRTYTLAPPLLYYHAEHELDASTITVVGPVIAESTPKRDVFDVAPLFFHIRGKPATGGIAEEHTTLFPFFHYGTTPDETLFILPGYYRRVARTSDTLISLFYTHAQGRSGATSLTAAGPIVPLWWDYRDRDLGLRTWALAPFFMKTESPVEHDWLTPLVGRFETYGESTTWWIFPTFTFASGKRGWEDDLHPLIYVGRNDDSSHTVVAPVFWDFASSKGRTTIGFPVYWRFADAQDDSVTQVAANTLYLQKRVPGGLDWSFHFLPVFSYGEDPGGYFWNVLFGLAGYSNHTTGKEVRAFWLPIDFGGASAPAQTAIAK